MAFPLVSKLKVKHTQVQIHEQNEKTNHQRQLLHSPPLERISPSKLNKTSLKQMRILGLHERFTFPSKTMTMTGLPLNFN